MSESEITLKDLFPSAVQGLARNVLASVTSSEQARQLEEKVIPLAGGLTRGLVVEEALHRLPEILDIRLVDVISGAWNKARELAKYTDQEKYPPDQVILTQLAKHTVRSDQHPYVQIYVNDQPVRERVVFDLSIVLTLKSVVLKIQNARIKGVKAGSCQAKGKIELWKMVLAEGTLGPFELPGAFDLGEGVRLKA